MSNWKNNKKVSCLDKNQTDITNISGESGKKWYKKHYTFCIDAQNRPVIVGNDVKCHSKRVKMITSFFLILGCTLPKSF